MFAPQRLVELLCPPHLVHKWRCEVLDTVPDAEAAIVQSITDLEQLRLSTAPISGPPIRAIMATTMSHLRNLRREAGVAGPGTKWNRDVDCMGPFRPRCCVGTEGISTERRANETEELGWDAAATGYGEVDWPR